MADRSAHPFTISSQHRSDVHASLAAGHAVVATLALMPRAQLTPEERTTLGSGLVRHQWGLGIGPDPCNKLYVMHRAINGGFENAELAIQLKSNPGQSTSAECRNRGYSPTSVHYTGAELGVLVVARSEDGTVLEVRGYDLRGQTRLSTDYSLLIPTDWNGRCEISLRGDNCFATGVITV